MKTVGISAEHAENSLVLISQHVPPGLTIGRPLICTRHPDGDISLLVDTDPPALWFVDTGEASRLVELDDGARHELTAWRWGVEQARVIR